MMLQHILAFSGGKARGPEIGIHFRETKLQKNGWKIGIRIRKGEKGRKREKGRTRSRVAEKKKLQEAYGGIGRWEMEG